MNILLIKSEIYPIGCIIGLLNSRAEITAAHHFHTGSTV